MTMRDKMTEPNTTIHPRIKRRIHQLDSIKKINATKGVRVVPYEEMTAFGKYLFDNDMSCEVEMDPGECEYHYASEQVKALQALYRAVTSPALKAKLKKRIQANTGVPYSKESEYLAMCYLKEKDENMKKRIADQMYGKDHILDIPADLEATLVELRSIPEDEWD